MKAKTERSHVRRPLMALSDDRVEIRGVLGRGRQSVVYMGWDHDRRAAISLKVQERSYGAERRALTLQHPYVVPVWERKISGGMERTVRPLIQGTNLEKLLQNLRPLGVRERERLTGKELLSFVGHAAGQAGFEGGASPHFEGLTYPQATALMGFQLSSALASAHDQGFIHQNLKPTNILISVTGNAYLTDFRTPEGLYPAVEGIYEKADRFSLISLLWELIDGRTLRTDSLPGLMRNEPTDSLSSTLLKFLQPEYFKQGTAEELRDVMWQFLNDQGAMGEELKKVAEAF